MSKFSFANWIIKRDIIKLGESLQGVSQAVTALTSAEIETKGIESIVDLTSIVPGVTVAKNEGYKTIISIRGIGNETNQMLLLHRQLPIILTVYLLLLLFPFKPILLT